MILRAERIAGLLESAEQLKDPLIITPEPDLQIVKESGSASIDLRLGTWFVTFRQTRMSVLKVLDHHGAPSIESQLTKTYYVPFGDKFILHPRSFVLGITLEWIRLPKNLAGYVIGRSSWGRRGLIIATAIGVHPGFTGCLTLELSNVGQVPISIGPGLAICQLFLHEASGTSDEIDRSVFIGRRKPVLGNIKEDKVAETLGKP